MRKQPFRIGRRQSIQDTGRTVQRDATGDRVVVKERVVERRHEGEAYVAGFVGYTLGHSFANVDGTGGLSTTGIESLAQCRFVWVNVAPFLDKKAVRILSRMYSSSR